MRTRGAGAPYAGAMNTGPQKPSEPSALVFDDPLSMPSADDTDRGWGERTAAGRDGAPAADAADLARFLDEKPPHHL